MDACAKLGVLYSGGGVFAAAGGALRVREDFTRAATFLQRACDGGVPDSCGKLARLYRDGQGVPEDPARAASLVQREVSLYERACDLEDTAACRQLDLPPFWWTRG
jgi:TPR repeat protein